MSWNERAGMKLIGRFIALSQGSEAIIAKALSDAEAAKRRATLALNAAREALRLSLSSPRIGAMLKEIDEELKNG